MKKRDRGGVEMQNELMEKLEGLPCAYMLVASDDDGTILYANDACYELLGCTNKEFQLKYGMRFSALLAVQDYLKVQQFLTSEQQQLRNLELLPQGKKATPTWVSASIKKHPELACYYVLLFPIQAYKQQEQDLKIMGDKIIHILQNTYLDIIEFDPETYTIKKHTGKTYFKSDTLEGQDVRNLIHSLIHEQDVSIFNNCCRKMECVPTDTSQGFKSACEVRLQTLQKEYTWTRLTSMRYQEHENEPYGIVIFANINAEKEATIKYVEQSLFYQAMLSAQSGYGHVDLSEDRITKVGGIWNLYNEFIDNKSYSEIFTSFIHKIVFTEDREHYINVMDANSIIKSYENGITHLGCEFRRIVDQNCLSWMEIAIYPFENPINHHIMALMYLRNIDEKKKQGQAVVRHMQYDDLTKLLDKEFVLDKIVEYLEHGGEQENNILLIVDIDGLRTINEAHGYLIGDQVIKKLGTSITKAFRKRDILGRYDGDKFIVLLKDIDDFQFHTCLDRLYELIETTQDPKYQVHIGVAFINGKEDIESCIRHANEALYQAKKNHLAFAIHDAKDEQQAKISDIEALDEEDQEILQTLKYVKNNAMESFETLLGKQGEIAYLVHPKTYELLIGNQAFYSRFGLQAEHCKGKTCYELLHHRKDPCPFCQKANWTSDRYYMYRDYNEVLEQEFLIKNKLISWKGNTTLLAIAVDLSNDKSIAASLENDATEANAIINGVQNMQKANGYEEIMHQALEAIGNYFKADCVRFWRMEHKKIDAEDTLTFARSHIAMSMIQVESQDADAINAWLEDHKWASEIMIESQEFMMLESYSMYQLMKRKQINNTRWLTLRDESKTLGLIEINNMNVNFQNQSFMTSLMTFITNELNKQQMMENIIYQANHDALTGLLNRSRYDADLKSFNEELVTSVAVIAANINDLGTINANLGTKAGDDYLRYLADCLSDIFKKATIYRLNGDEFQIILTNTSTEQVEKSIQRLHKKLKSFAKFSVSTGYAWDCIEKKVQPLIQTAIQSMMVNKQNYYLQMNNNRDNEHLDIQNQLIKSLDHGDYFVYLQPKFDIRIHQVVGAEALIRYRDEAGNIVPPIKYVPLFEKNGLIRYIDLFVFKEVCKILERWRSKDTLCPVISLNFSRMTMLEYDLIELMDEIVSNYQIEKKYIEIEITESYADVGKAALYQSAKRIHDAGYAIALDDFGVDYTNLSILSDIDVDVVKIDKSLIHSITLQKKNQIILKDVIQMCRDLNVEIIAEGVEQEEQRDLLKSLGCYLIQGYLYSKPIGIQEFEAKFLKG